MLGMKGFDGDEMVKGGGFSRRHTRFPTSSPRFVPSTHMPEGYMNGNECKRDMRSGYRNVYFVL